MARLRPILPLVLIALVSGLIAAAPASAQYPGVPWSDLLPPVASPDRPQPKPVAHCREPSIGCISTQARRLRAARERLGCDHRAVFATTYMVLTRHAKKWLVENPGEVSDHRYLFIEDALFANFYFRVLRAWDRESPVPEAWRIAFESAERGDYFGAQDMLLGINAHVQNDMPFLLASLGLTKPNGDSRKPDHDVANGTLNRAYEDVVAEVRDRFDPLIDLSNPEVVPLDDLAGLELVRGWRELVWRNAERLLNAKNKQEQRQVAKSIEDQAALTAQVIAAAGLPGYGATRDAYCAAGPSGN